MFFLFTFCGVPWLLNRDFTFVCPTEIISFSNKAEDFRKIGAEVIGVSVDSCFTHLAWINTPRKEGGLGGINIPLLSDTNHVIGENYGVMHLDTGFHLRGTFIIDPKQNVRHIAMNDPPVGRNVDEIFRLVEAFQSFEEHGEVCPANWQSKWTHIILNVQELTLYLQRVETLSTQTTSLSTSLRTTKSFKDEK